MTSIFQAEGVVGFEIDALALAGDIGKEKTRSTNLELDFSINPFGVRGVVVEPVRTIAEVLDGRLNGVCPSGVHRLGEPHSNDDFLGGCHTAVEAIQVFSLRQSDLAR